MFYKVTTDDDLYQFVQIVSDLLNQGRAIAGGITLDDRTISRLLKDYWNDPLGGII